METPDRKIRFDKATAQILVKVGRAQDPGLLLEVRELIECELRPIAFEVDQPVQSESVYDRREPRTLGED